MSSIILPLISRLSIADKNASIIPFSPNWAQSIYFNEIEKQLRASRPIRIIILKARQLGISTATEAFIYCLSFIVPNMNGLVIADEMENAHHLLKMTDTYWETDPFKDLYTTKYQAKNTLAWRETNSSIRTTTAGNKKAGRSRTIQALHASEVAFWLEADTVMTGLMRAIPTLPRTFIALESTANGRGNYFHKQWKGAIAGDNDYTPLFFPWWTHYEYRASHLGLPPRSLGEFDGEERALLALFKAGLDIGDIHYSIPPSEWEDALAWRRWSIRNDAGGDLVKFHQEMPATPEEAFVATGTNVFPQQHLAKCFKVEPGRVGRLVREGSRVTFLPDITGPLTIYRRPAPDLDAGIYSIGADATATIRGDYAVAQVINRRTFEQVAVWRGRIDPAHFGEECAKLGIYFNTALLAPENEGPGYATVGWLMNMDYPNMFQSLVADNLPGRFTGKYGWSSSYRSKDLAIGWTLRLLIEGGLTIHSRHTYDEMDNYVTLEGGGYGPAGGEEHDDAVMALAIAITASIQSGPIPAYGSGDGGGGEPEPTWVNWDVERETEGAGF